MKELTKEMLINYGITHITEEGEVYVNDTLKKPIVIVGKHKYGQDRKYLAIYFVNKNIKVPVQQSYKVKSGEVRKCPGWTYKIDTYPLARVMLAWFNGSIGSNEDADHIDSNPMNNKLENLQAISRKSNLAKRRLSHSQITLAYKKVQKLMGIE